MLPYHTKPIRGAQALAVTCLLLSTAIPSQASERYRLLAVGVDHYQHNSVSDLDGTMKDTQDIVRLFQAQDSELRYQLLPNEKATRKDILAHLDQILSTTQRQEL